jgi:hypothetical protein
VSVLHVPVLHVSVLHVPVLHVPVLHVSVLHVSVLHVSVLHVLVSVHRQGSAPTTPGGTALAGWCQNSILSSESKQCEFTD